VPVPSPVAFLDEEAGGPAYLMAFVPGISLGGARDLAKRPAEFRLTSLVSAAEALAHLHAVPIAGGPLERHGRGENYVSRQLARWLDQYTASPAPVTDSIPRTHERLLTMVGAQQSVSVVHGDYHFANLRLGGDGRVRAVLDWELSTLGDPLADLGTYLAYLDTDLWEGRLSLSVLSPSESAELDDIVKTYERSLGRSVPDLMAFIAFAHWKIACIGEGVLTRGAAAGEQSADMTYMVEFTRQHARAAELLVSPRPLASPAADSTSRRTHHV
jgi:aminoglycoside phosphotransferase (APT) family kinase protein